MLRLELDSNTDNFNFVERVLSLLLNAIIGALSCGLIKQTAQLNDGPGYLSRVVNDFSTFALDLADTPTRDVLQFDNRVQDEIVNVYKGNVEDVTKFDETNGLLTIGQQVINGVLGGINNDTNTLTINSFVDATTKNTGRFQFSYDDVLTLNSSFTEEASLTDAKASIEGLNTFESLKLVDNPMNLYDYTLSNNLALDKLKFSAGGKLKIIGQSTKPAVIPPNEFHIYTAKPLLLDLNLGIPLKDPVLELFTTIGLTPDTLNDVGIGQLLSKQARDGGTSLACASKAFMFLNITNVVIESFILEELDVGGNFDEGLKGFITTFSNLVNNVFGPFINDNLGSILRGYLDTLNAFLRKFIAESKSNLEKCPEFVPPSIDQYEPSYLDFTTSTLDSVRGFFESTLSRVDEPGVGINSVLKQYTGLFGYPREFRVGQVVKLNLPLEEQVANLEIRKLRIKNVDSFKAISLIEPAPIADDDGWAIADQKHITRNVLRLGYETTTADKGGPIELDLTLVVKPDVNSEPYKYPITLTLTEVDVDITLMIKSDITNLYTSTLGDVLNNPLCGVRAAVPRREEDLPGVRVKDLNINIKQIDFAVNCDCELDKQLETPEAKAAITKEFNTLIKAIGAGAVTEVATEQINVALAYVAESCTNVDIVLPGSFSADSTGIPVLLGTNGVGFGLVAIFVVFLACTSKGRKAKSSELMLREDETDLGFESASAMGSFSALKRQELKQSMKSLFFDSRISGASKLLVIVLTFVAAALITISNLSVNNSLENKLFVYDTEISVPSVFQVVIKDLIDDLMYLEAHLLAIGTALSSGFGSYLLLVGIVYCMIAPQSHLSVSTRSGILTVIRIASKFALLEKSVVLIVAAIFNITVVLPSPNGRESLSEIFSEDFLTVRVLFLPEMGFLLFFIGMVLAHSAAISVAYMHHSVVQQQWESERENLSIPDELTQQVTRASLFSHRFTVPLDKGEARLSAFGKLLVIVGFIIAPATYLYGYFADTFSIEMMGIAGFAINLVSGKEGHQVRDFSAASVAFGMTNGVELATTTQAITSYIVQIIVICITFVIPLLFMIVGAALAFAPVNYNARFTLVKFAGVLWQLSHAEVFWLTILNVSSEIRPLSQLATLSACVDIDKYLESATVPFGVPEEEATCIAADGTLLTPFAVYAVGTFGMYITAAAVIKLSKMAVDDYELRNDLDDRNGRLKKRKNYIHRLCTIGILKKC